MAYSLYALSWNSWSNCAAMATVPQRPLPNAFRPELNRNNCARRVGLVRKIGYAVFKPTEFWTYQALK
jgi:hypothetical protein